MNHPRQNAYLPRPQVAKRYGVTERTVARWQADLTLNFPKPMEVRSRLFFAVEGLEAWERARALGA